MTSRPRWIAVPVLLGLAVTAGADVVTTRDGLVLEGKATKAQDGGVTLTTDQGEVTLPASSVASVVEGDGPRALAMKAISEAATGDADAHYRLAVSLQAKGLEDLARSEFEVVVAKDQDHPAARRALGQEKVDGRWTSVAEARRRRGLVLYEGQWLLPAQVGVKAAAPRRVAVKDTPLATAMKTAATSRGALKQAAVERVDRAPHGERLEAATSLVVHPDAAVRKWASRELGRLGDQSALRALIAVSVRDRSPEVREAAVKAAGSFGIDAVAVPFVRAMWSEHPSIVANAAQALGWLGDPRTLVYVVKRIVSHGSSPKAYFAKIDETAYVQDFDVEVAQTSFIADPQIGTIQEGAVQDVKVLDAAIEQTIVETYLVGAVNSLAKASFKSVDEVKAWAKDHAKDLPTLASPDPRRHQDPADPANPADPATTPGTK